MELRLYHEVRPVQKLEQKLVRGYLLEMQLKLAGMVIGQERVDIMERCPKCGRDLEPIEVLDGFSGDPQDYDTTCPSCGQKWQPEMIVAPCGKSAVVNYRFYCPTQAAHALRQLVEMAPAEICRANAGLYRSAIIHFGSIKAAMKDAGVDYQFDEKVDWKTRLASLLGLVPDVMFARYARVSPSTVSRYRRQLGIRRFSNREIS